MTFQTLFESNLSNTLATIGIIILVGIIFFLEHVLIKKKEETWHKGILALIYLTSFIILMGTLLILMIIWGFDFQTYFSSIQSDLITSIEQSIGAIIGTAIVIVISMLILKISKITFKAIGKKPGTHQKRRRTISKVMLSIARYFIGIISILIILAIWGINVMPALAGLGILGLVIGLGAQKFINDLIAGFFIIFEQHFDVGDVVEVDGFKGEVTDIGLKTTRVRNWKGQIKILSNGQINTLINYSKNPSIAEVEFGIAYEEDVQKTIDILKAELPNIRKTFPQVLQDPQVLGVTNLADSSVNIKVICQTINEQHYGVERALRQLVKEILNKHDIEIPFPQVVINQKQ